MGVKHLWSIIDSAAQQGTPDDLAGKTVAVDLSIWIVESRSIASHQHQRHSLHLRTLFFRVLNMIYLNIKPIFILDSTKVIDLKLETSTKRSTHRTSFDRFINECSEMLNLLGIPIVRADGEAEKLCSQLNQMNIVDFVISDDSDCFIYGAKKVIRKFSIDIKAINFEIYDRHEIEETCRLNQRALLVLALILGSDYDRQGLSGFGKENALKYLQTIPTDQDPVDFLCKTLRRSYPNNKYQQRVYNLMKENPNTLEQFNRIIREFSSSTLENITQIKSMTNVKWLKPVRLTELQQYLKKKLGWIESYTFVKVFPLLTRFQILYRLNLLEVDVNDVLSLSDQTVFEAIAIKKIRLRQNKQYYEVEWKVYESDTSLTLDEQLNKLSLNVNDNDMDEDEKLITVEPTDLFRHAYPDIVHRFENPQSKRKFISNERKQTLHTQATSTSMSLDMLSFIEHPKIKYFEPRPSMAAFSTSIDLDVLNILDKSTENYFQMKQAKTRSMQKRTRSDLVVERSKNNHQPMNLFNTSMSLDVLNIVLRDDSYHPSNSPVWTCIDKREIVS